MGDYKSAAERDAEEAAARVYKAKPSGEDCCKPQMVRLIGNKIRRYLNPFSILSWAASLILVLGVVADNNSGSILIAVVLILIGFSIPRWTRKDGM